MLSAARRLLQYTLAYACRGFYSKVVHVQNLYSVDPLFYFFFPLAYLPVVLRCSFFSPVAEFNVLFFYVLLQVAVVLDRAAVAACAMQCVYVCVCVFVFYTQIQVNNAYREK